MEPGRIVSSCQKAVALEAAYQVADRMGGRALACILSGEAKTLLPMVELIEQAEMAVVQRFDCTGRVTSEAALNLLTITLRCRVQCAAVAHLPTALDRYVQAPYFR